MLDYELLLAHGLLKKRSTGHQLGSQLSRLLILHHLVLLSVRCGHLRGHCIIGPLLRSSSRSRIEAVIQMLVVSVPVRTLDYNSTRLWLQMMVLLLAVGTAVHHSIDVVRSELRHCLLAGRSSGRVITTLLLVMHSSCLAWRLLMLRHIL